MIERPKKTVKLSKLSHLPRREKNSIEQMGTLLYELGDLSRFLIKREGFKQQGNTLKAWDFNEHAKHACMDVLAQLVLLCEVEGWNFFELTSYGCERFREKIDRFVKYGEQ